MKITKYVHSCLLVEMPEPVNRTVLFDPGTMSETALDVDELEFLDDIIITHAHPDHFSETLLSALLAKFPEVRITTTPEVASKLHDMGANHVLTEPSDGIGFFDAPHEDVAPLFPQPQEIGVHYLDLMSHPGDSHSFSETKAILALPVSAPWGAAIPALQLAIRLKPKYVLPIHDWHWSDEARTGMYQLMGDALSKEGIELVKLETGQPVVLDV